MSDYDAFFLSSPASVVELELFEIEHPSFTQVYRYVRNATEGVTVTLEDDSVESFTYLPMRVRPTGSSDDLDQTLRFELGDLGEVLPTELDAVLSTNGARIRPTVRYRVYRSDDLTQPLFGPILMEVPSMSFAAGCTFEARAPSLNVNRTGELYRIDRFPMMRGLM